MSLDKSNEILSLQMPLFFELFSFFPQNFAKFAP